LRIESTTMAGSVKLPTAMSPSFADGATAAVSAMPAGRSSPPGDPACRRERVDGTPVAICRLKRVAADHRGDITERMPTIPAQKNGKRVACVGAGPASLTVADELSACPTLRLARARSGIVGESCDSVASLCGDVWLDGAYLGDTEGYFFPHTFEVTEHLRSRSEHQLAVEVDRRHVGRAEADVRRAARALSARRDRVSVQVQLAVDLDPVRPNRVAAADELEGAVREGQPVGASPDDAHPAAASESARAPLRYRHESHR